MAAPPPVMETALLCTWGGFAMQIASAGALHLWPKQRWIGWVLLGSGWLVFVLAFARWYIDRHPGAESLVWASGGAVLPPALIFAWFRFPKRMAEFSKQYRFRWPIERKKGWPFSASLDQRIHHIRTYMYFDRLEDDRIIRLCLVLLNSMPEEILIDSVGGKVLYDQLGPDAAPPLTWVDAGNISLAKISPLDTRHIQIEQRVPADAVLRLREDFAQRKSVSFVFGGIQIAVKSTKTSETATVRLWNGAVYNITDNPALEGILTFITTSSPAGWSGSKVGQ